jgi:hypothetical protein
MKMNGYKFKAILFNVVIVASVIVSLTSGFRLI